MQSEELEGLLVGDCPDLMEFAELQKLPYLKHIEMVKFTPRHFGLDNWKRLFVIPDNLMRKIYRHDIWKDTEIEYRSTVEELTMEQKRTLNEWLRLDSPFRYELVAQPVEEQNKRNRTHEDDDLKELLDRSDDWLNQSEKILVPEAKIAVCYDHCVKPEKVIVEKAIEKMNHLSDEEKSHFQSLLNDTEFMTFLDDKIKRYLENCT